MKPLAVAIVAVVSSITAVLIARVAIPASVEGGESTAGHHAAAEASRAASAADVEELRQRVAELTEGVTSLRESIESRPWESARVPQPAQAAQLPEGEIEALVLNYLEEYLDRPVPSSPRNGASDVSDLSAAAVVDRLLGHDGEALSGLAVQELWQTVRDSGRMEEILGEFERRVELDPTNPQARADLGMAYIQKLQEVSNGPLAGVWAGKADREFDEALRLDPDHWEARFSKAVALSFWPPVFNKQPAAIEQFEILIEKQAHMPRSDDHAQTYLLLGNLYNQSGEKQKALDIWRRGLEQFPQNQALAAKLEKN